MSAISGDYSNLYAAGRRPLPPQPGSASESAAAPQAAGLHQTGCPAHGGAAAAGGVNPVDEVAISPEAAELAVPTAGGAPSPSVNSSLPAAGTTNDQQVSAAGGVGETASAGGGGEELTERVKRIEQMLQGLGGGGQAVQPNPQVPAA
jgi:hypothetical protein